MEQEEPISFGKWLFNNPFFWIALAVIGYVFVYPEWIDGTPLGYKFQLTPTVMFAEFFWGVLSLVVVLIILKKRYKKKLNRIPTT